MKQLVSIQILRAVAALAIALLHALNDATAISIAATPAHPFAPASLMPLSAGVDLFFVISGFVMVYASQGLFTAEGGARRFLIRRITRIVPLYWMTTTAFLAIAFVLPGVLNSEGFTAWQVVASYLFIPAMRPDGLQQPVYSLGWTLNYEMFFYLIFAAFISRPREDAIKWTAITLTGLIALGYLVPSMGMPFTFWCNNIMLEFVFGMLLANAFIKGWRIPLWAGCALIAGGLALLHIDAAITPLPFPRSIAWGMPTAMLLAGVVFVERSAHDGAITRAFVAVGDASYALYLTHPFAMRALKQVWLKLGFGAVANPWLYVAITLGLAIALSLAIFRFFERPTTIALKARFDRG